MKTILAYGDSLTWGAHPVTALRHSYDDLWPSVLAARLGATARVIQDGVGGRTTSRDDYTGPSCRNAVKSLPVALAAHMPLDLVILMLGTNDLKPMHGASALAAQNGMRRLVHLVRTQPYKPASAVPQVLLVAPPECRVPTGRDLDGPHRVSESKRFSTLYQALADELGTGFFDAATVATASIEDGVHLHADQTRAIGAALASPVAAMLGIDLPE